MKKIILLVLAFTLALSINAQDKKEVFKKTLKVEGR